MFKCSNVIAEQNEFAKKQQVSEVKAAKVEPVKPVKVDESKPEQASAAASKYSSLLVVAIAGD